MDIGIGVWTVATLHLIVGLPFSGNLQTYYGFPNIVT